MALLRILNYPDPRLKTIAPAVEDIHDPTVQQMIADMLETLKNTPHCGGLAATQLDIKAPQRIFVFYDSNDRALADAVCVVNPEIIAMEGEVHEPEGCMSVYCEHITAAIKRPARTRIRALSPDGKTIELERDGYLAKLFEHEIDHLNGKLYIDHLGMTSMKRRLIERKVAKVKRALKRQQDN
ncbi:MAG: peptide deformylase [Gammaproteobacteria bacterium]|nr:peptide deformylase [Gammaproteobacteria bacterium]